MLFEHSNDSMRLFPQFTVVDMNSDQNRYNHLSLVKVSGEDALDFLQGQLTNDLLGLDDHWHYQGYCSPKGRAMAVFIAWRASNAIYLMTDSSVYETVINRLKMYVLRSKVVFEHIDSNYLLGHALNNDNASKTFDMYSMEQHEGYFMLGFGNRVLVVNAEDYARTELPSTLSLDQKTSMTEENWKEADIKANLPRVTEATSESFVPQMLNLDLLDGISFKKGCYTGQEIVARMKYLGKLKQRQYTAELSQNIGLTAIAIGDKVLTEDRKTAGLITNFTPTTNTVTAVLRSEAVHGPLYLETQETLSVSVLDQPYPIESQN